MKVFLRAASAVALSVSIMSCGGDDSGTDPGDNNSAATVQASASLQFSPATVDIAVGESVTWVFGAVSHTVQFNQVAGAPTNIGASNQKSVTRTFSTAGVYPYICTIHAGMTGTVRVGQ